MNVTSVILLFVVLVVLLYGLGLLFPGGKDEKSTFSIPMLRGVVAMWAYFEVVALACIFLETSFDILVLVFLFPLVAVCALSYILNRKHVAKAFVELKNHASFSALAMLPAIAIIVLQIYMYVKFQHLDQDDAHFVGMACTAVDTNTLFKFSAYTGELLDAAPIRYIFSPFFFFYGIFAKILAISPTIVAHTVLPIFLVPLCYLVYWTWSRKLFPKSIVSRGVFLALIGVIQIWGCFSDYSSSTFFIIRIWQGKAILCSTLLPLLLYELYRIWEDGLPVKNLPLLLCTTLSCCMVSSMGVILGLIMVGCCWILRMIKARSIKDSWAMLLGCIPAFLVCVAYYVMK